MAKESATILNSFPSMLSMPGGLSLWIGNNTSPTLTLQNSNLQCYFRPSFWNFGFPGYSYYIVINASNGYRYSFRTKFHSISKNVINTCGWSCSCSVPAGCFEFLPHVTYLGFPFHLWYSHVNFFPKWQETYSWSCVILEIFRFLINIW